MYHSRKNFSSCKKIFPLKYFWESDSNDDEVERKRRRGGWEFLAPELELSSNGCVFIIASFATVANDIVIKGHGKDQKYLFTRNDITFIFY